MRALRSAALLLIVPFLGTMQVPAPTRDQRPVMPTGDSTITGRVLTSEGRPVARARVNLRRTGDMGTTGGGVGGVLGGLPGAVNAPIRVSGPGAWQQTTDATGQFTFSKIPAGTYSLSAAHSQYLSAQYGQRFVGQPGRPIELAAGQTLRADLIAVRGGAITGRVFDETGEPMSDVSVQAYRYATQGTRRQLVPAGGRSYSSNDIGQYRIANLPPGDYLIAAQYRGQIDPSQQQAGVRQGYAPTYYPGAAAPSAAQAIRVMPGNEAPNVDFALQPTLLARVSGTIVTSSGEPGPGTQLFAMPLESELVATSRMPARVMADGTFTVSDLTPGEYLFTAQRVAGAGQRGGTAPRGTGPPSSTRRDMEYGSVKVHVAGEPIDNLSIQLRPGAEITVRVASDTPLPGSRSIMLMAEQQPAVSQSRSVSGNGDVVFHSGPGRYRVTAGGLPPGWIVERVMAGPRDVTASGLTVTDGTPIDVTVHVSSRGATLTGHVMTIGSPAPADYTVVVLAENAAERTGLGRGVLLARPDQSGQFAVRSLRAGSYFVAAVDYVDPNELYDPAFWARVEPNAIRVTLSAGESRQIAAPFISRR